MKHYHDLTTPKSIDALQMRIEELEADKHYLIWAIKRIADLNEIDCVDYVKKADEIAIDTLTIFDEDL